MRSGVSGFQAKRLVQLRNNSGLTQSELAESIECSKGNISKWENGLSSPEAESFGRICKFFGVPESWLLEQPISSVDDKPSFYRALKSAPKASKTKAASLLDWSEELSYKLQESLEFPEVNIPELNESIGVISDHDIEELASECRDRWGLGSAPILDLMNVVESNGVVVTSASLGYTKMDGVSRWSTVDQRPYVFLCTDKSNGFRSRFDLAHELGHAVMHRHVSESEYKKHYHLLESHANRFASALLLPADSFARDIRYPTLDTFLALKPKWKASVAAMIHRCRDLEIINEDMAKRLYKARSARKWTSREPLDDTLDMEAPKLLKRSVMMLVENKVLSRDVLKRVLGAPVDVIEQLCSLPDGYFNSRDDGLVELKLRSRANSTNKRLSEQHATDNVVSFESRLNRER